MPFLPFEAFFFFSSLEFPCLDLQFTSVKMVDLLRARVPWTGVTARRRRGRGTNSRSSGTSSRFALRVSPVYVHRFSTARPALEFIVLFLSPFLSLSLSLSLSLRGYLLYRIYRFRAYSRILISSETSSRDTKRIREYNFLDYRDESSDLFFGERARVCRRRSMDSIGFSLSPSIHESWLAVSFQRNTLSLDGLPRWTDHASYVSILDRIRRSKPDRCSAYFHQVHLVYSSRDLRL